MYLKKQKTNNLHQAVMQSDEYSLLRICSSMEIKNPVILTTQFLVDQPVIKDSSDFQLVISARKRVMLWLSAKHLRERTRGNPSLTVRQTRSDLP